MSFKCVLLLLVICVVRSQCATIEDEVRNSTKFTLDFYRSSFIDGDNMVMSPISFRILLSLLYQSTVGETEDELRDNLYLTNKHETAVSQRQTLDKIMQSPSLKVVNRVYVKEGVQLSQLFHAKALEYHSGIEQKDFSKSQQTANEINQFVEEQTNHLIKNLVSPDNLNVDTALLLLNTLYFKADWAIPFEGHLYKTDFKGIDGRNYSIDFMTKEEYFNGYHSDDLKAWTIKLDYVNGSNCKFVMILPDSDTNINEVKDKLNTDSLNVILSDKRQQLIHILMPKFEIESEIAGKEELKKLGLNSLFLKEEIQALQSDQKLTVSDAKQKVKIVVNTKGTEAAAASFVSIMAISARQVEWVNFVRPFIYLIVTADTNEPLFIGHYSKPGNEYAV